MNRIRNELKVALIHSLKLDDDYRGRYAHHGKGYQRVDAQVYPEPDALQEKLVFRSTLSVARLLGVNNGIAIDHAARKQHGLVLVQVKGRVFLEEMLEEFQQLGLYILGQIYEGYIVEIDACYHKENEQDLHVHGHSLGHALENAHFS